MKLRRTAAALTLALYAGSDFAATLHGRVKDQQCDVLAKVTVQIRASHSEQFRTTQTLTTDDAGNYTADLAPGTYEICFKRATAAAVCTGIDMPAIGDKWVTTQLRDAAPDLSGVGNRSF